MHAVLPPRNELRLEFKLREGHNLQVSEVSQRQAAHSWHSTRHAINKLMRDAFVADEASVDPLAAMMMSMHILCSTLALIVECITLHQPSSLVLSSMRIQVKVQQPRLLPRIMYHCVPSKASQQKKG
jgi:hypothetical protein